LPQSLGSMSFILMLIQPSKFVFKIQELHKQYGKSMIKSRLSSSNSTSMMGHCS
jgi:hypothetical protein